MLVLLVVVAIIFRLGVFILAPEEVAVIELLGKFHRIAGPGGLNWRLPFLTRIRAVVDTWEQEIPLFDQGEIKIDLADGWIKPKEAKAFIRVQNPEYAIYKIADWRSAIKSLAETLTSSYLRAFPLDQVLQGGRGGFDISDQINRRSKELDDEVKLLRAKKDKSRLLKTKADLDKAYEDIQGAESSWGIEIKQIYVPDYDLSLELRRARDEVHEAERRAKAAIYHTAQMQRETSGLYAAIKDELESKGYDTESAREIAIHLWQYWRGTDKGNIIDIQGDAVSSSLAQFFALFEKMKGAVVGGGTSESPRP